MGFVVLAFLYTAERGSLWKEYMAVVGQRPMYTWFMVWTLAHISTDIYLARLNLAALQDPRTQPLCEHLG